MCVDRELTPDQTMLASRLALEENPSNAPAPPRFSPGLGLSDQPPPLALAAVTGMKWKAGRTLKVALLNGEELVKEKVKHFAKLWEPFANVKFDFVDDSDADVRVAFDLNGRSWSYLGVQALSIPEDEPTMNYGWLTPESEEAEFERVICHEFGHALGCIHEHQHPEAGIPWDKEAVYAYYAGPPNFWPKETVNHNLFRRYSRTMTQFSDFDTKSIMLYSVPNELTLGDFEIGWNRALSETDKKFVGVMYPKDEVEIVVLQVDADPTEAEIGEHGEEDVFNFAVASEARHVVETTGSTDVVMSLLGPDDASRVLAQDDDSGLGLNARISAKLDEGEYVLRLRHYRPRGKGEYGISVRLDE